MQSMSRRAAIVGAISSTAALAVPAVAAATNHVDPTDAMDAMTRATYYAHKVAEAMAEAGQWVITIKGGEPDQSLFFENRVHFDRDNATLNFIRNAPALDRIEWHAMEMAKASAKEKGGLWKAVTWHDSQKLCAMVFQQDRNAPRGAMIEFA
jgi:hypothetical protein